MSYLGARSMIGKKQAADQHSYQARAEEKPATVPVRKICHHYLDKCIQVLLRNVAVSRWCN